MPKTVPSEMVYASFVAALQTVEELNVAHRAGDVDRVQQLINLLLMMLGPVVKIMEITGHAPMSAGNTPTPESGHDT